MLSIIGINRCRSEGWKWMRQGACSPIFGAGEDTRPVVPNCVRSSTVVVAAARQRALAYTRLSRYVCEHSLNWPCSHQRGHQIGASNAAGRPFRVYGPRRPLRGAAAVCGGTPFRGRLLSDAGPLAPSSSRCTTALRIAGNAWRL